MRLTHFTIGILIAAVIFVIDQWSKHWLLGIMYDAPGDIAVTSFFNLVMVWNKGISFGMFAEHDQPYVLIALALGIVAVLLRWLWTGTSRVAAVAIGLVIGGALGNVMDRLRFGAVADFFDFHLFGYHWPAFNIADATIFIGVVILLLESMVSDRKQP